MADYGSHSTVASIDNPSIYDIVAQESLLENLQPAFDHALKVLTDKFPAKLSALYLYSEEVYFVLQSLLQFHYLTNYGASFSENFYGLKRRPLSSKGISPNILGLDRKVLTKSLVTLCVVPYLRHWLKTKHLQRADGPAERKTMFERLKSRVIDLWPYINLVIEVTTIVYYLRYVLGRQKVQNPFLHLCGASLTCLTEEDSKLIELRSQQMMKIGHIKSLRSFAQWIAATSGHVMQNSLEIGAFFLQFLDWFYSNNATKAQLFASNVIPPPPPQPVNAIDPKLCPLCFKERQQDTVLSVSGYVFCYSCILQFVKRRGICPVTKCPATTKQLIRIYKR